MTLVQKHDDDGLEGGAAERAMERRRASHGVSRVTLLLGALLLPLLPLVWLPLACVVLWYRARSPNYRATPRRWLCPIQPPQYARDFRAIKTDVSDDRERKGNITVWTLGNVATATDIVVLMHAADDNPSVWLDQARQIVQRGTDIACVLPWLPGYEPSSSYMSSNIAVLADMLWSSIKQCAAPERVSSGGVRRRYHFQCHGMGVCMVRHLATPASAASRFIKSWTVWAIPPKCGQGLGRIARQNPPQLLASWYVPTFQIPYVSDVLYTRNEAALVKKFCIDWAPVGRAVPDDHIAFARQQFCQPGVVTSVLRQYRATTMLDPFVNRIPKFLWPQGTQEAINAAFADLAPHIYSKYICGEQDGVGLWRTLQLFNVWLKEQNKPELVLLPEAGHWLMMDQPELSFEIICEQLRLGGAMLK